MERTKIKGAIRTDFILSAEIIVITLGTVAGAAFGTQVAVLVGIGLLMTAGVYGLVAGIVKLMGYRVLGAIVEALRLHGVLAHSDWTILDAGTGLLGEAMRNAEFTGRLIGLDLSPNSITFIDQHRPGVYV